MKAVSGCEADVDMESDKEKYKKRLRKKFFVLVVERAESVLYCLNSPHEEVGRIRIGVLEFPLQIVWIWTFYWLKPRLHHKEEDYDTLNKRGVPTFSRKSLFSQPLELLFLKGTRNSKIKWVSDERASAN